MRRSVAGVKDHEAHKDHHVRQAVQRRIEKTPEARDPAGKSGYLAVEHVKKVGHNQGDARCKEPAQPKEKTASDVQSHADYGQNVGIDVPIGEPAYDGIDNSLSSPSNTCPKHVLGY